MTTRARSAHDLRCTCRHEPLLALYGISEDGKPYLHIKAWKAGRLITEAIFTGGTARILCRECHRWYKIVFRTARASLEQVSVPAEIAG